MTIKLDPTGTGEWLDCVSLSDISLPEDWATDAYVGLTAATGQLSGEQNFAWELTKISKLQNAINATIYFIVCYMIYLI